MNTHPNQVAILAAAGKTIRQVLPRVDSNLKILFYNDGTFSVLRTDWDYEDPVLSEDYRRPDCEELLVQAGVMSREEQAARARDDRATLEAQWRKQRFLDYQRLKREFEGVWE